jgi:hypothetical protein
VSTLEGRCQRLAHGVNISALPPEVLYMVAAALSSDLPDAGADRVVPGVGCGGLALLRDAWQRFGSEKLFADGPQVRGDTKYILIGHVIGSYAIGVPSAIFSGLSCIFLCGESSDQGSRALEEVLRAHHR